MINESTLKFETDLMLEVYQVTTANKKVNNNNYLRCRCVVAAYQNIPMKTNDLLCMNYVSGDCVRI